ncbi:MAG: acyl-CoA thioesterase [Rhodospirillales bacterium]|nr:acyl-CoA thioesterase [Rhodospirillales bacterium]
MTESKTTPTLPAGVPMIRTIAMPADTNPAGDIFGGWLMAQMDLAAGNAAARRARGRCVTIAVDGMAFLSPVHVGDEVSLYARVLSVGRTSMKILVEAWRRPRHDFDSVQVTKATFTFVAIDENGRPRPVPEPSDPLDALTCDYA